MATQMELYHSTTPHGYKTTIISSYAHLAGGKDKVYKGCPYIIYTNLMGETDKATNQTRICITGHVQGKPSILIYV